MTKKEQRQLVKKLHRKFGRSPRQLPLLKRIVASVDGRFDLLEEYDKMEAWCASKNKNGSLMRFNNWVKRSIDFRGGNIGEVDIEREKRETLERFKD